MIVLLHYDDSYGVYDGEEAGGRDLGMISSFGARIIYFYITILLNSILNLLI